MNRRPVPCATYLNSFGVRNPKYKLLNILRLNGGTMSMGDLMQENTDPHEITVYSVFDYLHDGFVEYETDGVVSEEADAGKGEVAERFRLDPDARIRLSEAGMSALER